MEVREKKDEKMEMTSHQEKPITKRNGSDPDLEVVPPPRSYARPSQTSPPSKVRYKECQRNHAASSGGHVIDGCGEFMSSGEEGTAESLLCAACECHRSFHRKEIDGVFVVKFNRPIISRHVSPIMMNFGGGGGVGGRDPAESSTEDLNKFHQSLNGVDQFQYHPKKRFRTKFSQEQKGKMMEFAEKIGWRMSKQEDDEVNRFCREINVKRQVFKVWMHNNKQTAKKKDM